MHYNRFVSRMIMGMGLLLVSCAQPKYENAVAPGSLVNWQNQQEADCSIQFQPSRNCLAWKWEVLPTENSPGAILFKVYRPNIFDRTLVSLDFSPNPNLVLWMPDMGHGSSPTIVDRLDVGTYRARNVLFVMPGKWQLKFQIESGGVVNDAAIIDISI